MANDIRVIAGGRHQRLEVVLDLEHREMMLYCGAGPIINGDDPEMEVYLDLTNRASASP